MTEANRNASVQPKPSTNPERPKTMNVPSPVKATLTSTEDGQERDMRTVSSKVVKGKVVRGLEQQRRQEQQQQVGGEGEIAQRLQVHEAEPEPRQHHASV